MSEKIKFITHCPKCGSELNIDTVQVRCENKQCPSRIIGAIINYCSMNRIESIGKQTIEALYNAGFIKKGIADLYKLKSHAHEINNLSGFGSIKTASIIQEIESSRDIEDYQFFGSLGIDGLSIKTFKLIFNQIEFKSFMKLIDDEDYNILSNKLLKIDGIGFKKISILIEYLKDNIKNINKLLKELKISSSIYGLQNSSNIAVISGFRDDPEIINILRQHNYIISDSWTSKAKCLIIQPTAKATTKVLLAEKNNIPIYTREEVKNGERSLPI